MRFSFSVVTVKSEPEVLANKGEKCYHCRLRHHDHDHRQHQCGLFTPAENTMRAVLNSLCRETGAAEPILGLSAGTDTAGHDLPVEDAGAEPLQNRSRTPAERRQEQTGPSPPPGNWHPAPAPMFPPPRPLLPHQHYMPPPRQAYVRSARMVSSAYAMASCAFSTASTTTAV